jgi:hypothetical protein
MRRHRKIRREQEEIQWNIRSKEADEKKLLND